MGSDASIDPPLPIQDKDVLIFTHTEIDRLEWASRLALHKGCSRINV